LLHFLSALVLLYFTL